MTDTSAPLLPCPFCGRAPKLYVGYESDNSCQKVTIVSCWTDDCPGGDSSHVFPSEAIARWNKRPKEITHA